MRVKLQSDSRSALGRGLVKKIQQPNVGITPCGSGDGDPQRQYVNVLKLKMLRIERQRRYEEGKKLYLMKSKWVCSLSFVIKKWL